MVLLLKNVCVLSHFSHLRLFVILRTAANQAPLFIGFSMQEYWRGLPCPPPGDLPDPGTELISVTSPPLAGRFFTKGFPCDSAGKEATCNAGDLGSILDWEDPLEKGKATYSRILAWRIPWTV